MGPYCNYCQRRCFTPFPMGTPREALAAYRPGVSIIATCGDGQSLEMARTGWNYHRIMQGIRRHRCQFCGQQSPVSEWQDDACPRCGRQYDWMLAQDTEDD